MSVTATSDRKKNPITFCFYVLKKIAESPPLFTTIIDIIRFFVCLKRIYWERLHKKGTVARTIALNIYYTYLVIILYSCKFRYIKPKLVIK